MTLKPPCFEHRVRTCQKANDKTEQFRKIKRKNEPNLIIIYKILFIITVKLGYNDHGNSEFTAIVRNYLMTTF